MKKTCFARFCAGFMLIATLIPAAQAAEAADIIFTGSGRLRAVPWNTDTAALFPGDSFADNTVTVVRGTVQGGVYGAASANKPVENNCVILSGGMVEWNICGGESARGAAENNGVEIRSGKARWSVYGGKSASSAASGNGVEIYGGEITYDVYGGFSEDGAAKNNHVTIQNGRVKENVLGGASVNGEASGNKALIRKGTVDWSVIGGESLAGAARDNHVTIEGGSVSQRVYGGRATAKSAEGNSVTITGGVIGDEVYGGYSAEKGAVNNRVTISGGKIKGNVYAGWSEAEDAAVTNNTITISGKPDLSRSMLFGSTTTQSYEKDGNILVADRFTGALLGIEGFERVELKDTVMTIGALRYYDGSVEDVGSFRFLSKSALTFRFPDETTVILSGGEGFRSWEAKGMALTQAQKSEKSLELNIPGKKAVTITAVF